MTRQLHNLVIPQKSFDFGSMAPADNPIPKFFQKYATPPTDPKSIQKDLNWLGSYVTSYEESARHQQLVGAMATTNFELKGNVFAWSTISFNPLDARPTVLDDTHANVLTMFEQEFRAGTGWANLGIILTRGYLESEKDHYRELFDIQVLYVIDGFLRYQQLSCYNCIHDVEDQMINYLKPRVKQRLSVEEYEEEFVYPTFNAMRRKKPYRVISMHAHEVLLSKYYTEKDMISSRSDWFIMTSPDADNCTENRDENTYYLYTGLNGQRSKFGEEKALTFNQYSHFNKTIDGIPIVVVPFSINAENPLGINFFRRNVECSKYFYFKKFGKINNINPIAKKGQSDKSEWTKYDIRILKNATKRPEWLSYNKYFDEVVKKEGVLYYFLNKYISSTHEIVEPLNFSFFVNIFMEDGNSEQYLKDVHSQIQKLTTLRHEATDDEKRFFNICKEQNVSDLERGINALYPDDRDDRDGAIYTFIDHLKTLHKLGCDTPMTIGAICRAIYACDKATIMRKQSIWLVIQEKYVSAKIEFPKGNIYVVLYEKLGVLLKNPRDVLNIPDVYVKSVVAGGENMLIDMNNNNRLNPRAKVNQLFKIRKRNVNRHRGPKIQKSGDTYLMLFPYSWGINAPRNMFDRVGFDHPDYDFLSREKLIGEDNPHGKEEYFKNAKIFAELYGWKHQTHSRNPHAYFVDDNLWVENSHTYAAVTNYKYDSSYEPEGGKMKDNPTWWSCVPAAIKIDSINHDKF